MGGRENFWNFLKFSKIRIPLNFYFSLQFLHDKITEFRKRVIA